MVKADKGNQSVVMLRKDYDEKCLAQIQTSDVLEISEGRQVIIKKCLSNLKDTLANVKEVFGESFYLPGIIPSNPQLSRFCGLPKLHKNGVPIRPIVSGLNTTCYKLACYISKLLTGLDRVNPHHLKDSKDFLKTLKTWDAGHSKKFNNLKMGSLDMTSLYPSVPPAEVYPMVQDLLLKNGYSLVGAQKIIRLLRLVNGQNFFTFCDRIFLQTDGLAMGSLAPILANLFMENFEENLFAKYPVLKLWVRYVDDVFILHTGCIRPEETMEIR